MGISGKKSGKYGKSCRGRDGRDLQEMGGKQII